VLFLGLIVVVLPAAVLLLVASAGMLKGSGLTPGMLKTRLLLLLPISPAISCCWLGSGVTPRLPLL
jgi:hypothetical protein